MFEKDPQFSRSEKNVKRKYEVVLPCQEITLSYNEFLTDVERGKYSLSGNLEQGIEETMKILSRDDKYLSNSRCYEGFLNSWNTGIKDLVKKGEIDTAFKKSYKWAPNRFGGEHNVAMERQFRAGIIIAMLMDYLGGVQGKENMHLLEVGAGGSTKGEAIMPEFGFPICTRILGVLAKNGFLKIGKLITIDDLGFLTGAKIIPEYEEKFGVTALKGHLQTEGNLGGLFKADIDWWEKRLEMPLVMKVKEPKFPIKVTGSKVINKPFKETQVIVINKPQETEAIADAYPYDLIYAIYLNAASQLYSLIPLLKNEGRIWNMGWDPLPFDIKIEHGS